MRDDILFFSHQNVRLYSLMVKTGDEPCMGLLKRWFKMEFYIEPWSQCRICDYNWFKTSERPYTVQSKWNSTLNRDLSVEPVTTAGSKPVRGCKKSSQNVNCDLWLRLIHQWEVVFDALFSLLLYCYHCVDIVGTVYRLLFIVVIVRS